MTNRFLPTEQRPDDNVVDFLALSPLVRRGIEHLAAMTEALIPVSDHPAYEERRQVTEDHTCGGELPTNVPARPLIEWTEVPNELLADKIWAAWTWCESRYVGWHPIPVAPLPDFVGASFDGDGWTVFHGAGGLSVALGFAGAEGLPGVGIVSPEGSRLSLVCIHDCRDLTTGRTENWALDLVKFLDSYAEFTPDGRGIRVAVKGSESAWVRTNIYTDQYAGPTWGRVEMSNRFALWIPTGHRLEAAPKQVNDREDRLRTLDDLIDRLGGPFLDETELPEDIFNRKGLFSWPTGNDRLPELGYVHLSATWVSSWDDKS